VRQPELGPVDARHDLADAVFAVRGDPFEAAVRTGRYQHVVLHRLRLTDGPKPRSRGQLRSGRNTWGEPPRALIAQSPCDAAGLDPRACQVQRAQHPVEHPAQQAGAELDLQRPAGSEHLVARLQPAGVLVHLHDRALALECDHLARQVLGTDMDEVEHRQPLAGFDLGDRAVDPCDDSVAHRHSRSISSAIASKQRLACASSE